MSTLFCRVATGHAAYQAHWCDWIINFIELKNSHTWLVATILDSAILDKTVGHKKNPALVAQTNKANLIGHASSIW